MTTTIRPASDLPLSAPPTTHQTRVGASASSVTSPKRLARIAGVLYLINILGGLFAIGYVPNVLIVDGDMAATARTIQANELSANVLPMPARSPRIWSRSRWMRFRLTGRLG